MTVKVLLEKLEFSEKLRKMKSQAQLAFTMVKHHQRFLKIEGVLTINLINMK